MKTQKQQDPAEIKEELDIKQIQKKYGGEEYMEIDYIFEIESEAEKETFDEHEMVEKLRHLFNELKKAKADLENARENGYDTAPIYREKQKLEEKISKLKRKLEKKSDKGDAGKDNESMAENRDGTIRIRHEEKGHYTPPSQKITFKNRKK